MILFIILLIAFYYLFIHNNEHYGSSQGGALIQLFAKGQQDQYLTGPDPRYSSRYWRE